MLRGAVAPEIHARRERHAAFVQHLAAKACAVVGERGAIGIHEKAAGGHHRNHEAQFAQRGHEEIAAGFERAPPLFEDRERGGLETGKRRALRRCGRRNVQVLRQLLQVAHVPLRRHQPAQAPARHVEIFREAGNHERIVGEFQHAVRMLVHAESVGQAEIDFIDDELASMFRHGGDDLAHFFVRHDGAGRIRRRRDQCAARRRRPVPVDQLRRQLIVRFRPDRDADGIALEDADEMAIARITRIGQQNPVVAVDEERHDQQQRRRRPRGDDDALGGHGHAVVIGVVRRDRAPQLGKPERGRVVDVARGNRALRRGHDRMRRRKVRFADFHVHDRAARRFQRPRGRLHLHDMKGRDFRDARRGGDAGIHRKS